MSYLAKNYNRKKISFKKGKGSYLFTTSGKKYLEPDVAQQMAITQLSGENNPVEILSDREFEVFIALAKGKSTNEIAETITSV